MSKKQNEAFEDKPVQQKRITQSETKTTESYLLSLPT
jgi:hypothetical protein